jgi:hypothetical protein
VLELVASCPENPWRGRPIERPRRLSEGAQRRAPEDSEEVNGLATYEAYCVKCKAKREFEGEETTLKNGRKAAKGKCPVCGTTVMRILGKAS